MDLTWCYKNGVWRCNYTNFNDFYERSTVCQRKDTSIGYKLYRCFTNKMWEYYAFYARVVAYLYWTVYHKILLTLAAQNNSLEHSEHTDLSKFLTCLKLKQKLPFCVFVSALSCCRCIILMCIVCFILVLRIYKYSSIHTFQSRNKTFLHLSPLLSSLVCCTWLRGNTVLELFI